MNSDLIWWGVAATVVGCYLFKIAGLSVPESVLEHPLTVRVADLIPVGLLGALIAVQVLADGENLVFDARIPALGVAAFLLWRKVPFLPMVAAAAATAALLRLLT